MKYSILKLITDKEYRLRDLEKLRGFLIQKYEGNTIFHNHVSGNFDYSYPKFLPCPKYSFSLLLLQLRL